MEFPWGNASKGPITCEGLLTQHGDVAAATPTVTSNDENHCRQVQRTLQNDGCSIHEGHAVKRALLFAGQPLLPWLGRSNPSARSA